MRLAVGGKGLLPEREEPLFPLLPGVVKARERAGGVGGVRYWCGRYGLVGAAITHPPARIERQGVQPEGAAPSGSQARPPPWSGLAGKLAWRREDHAQAGIMHKGKRPLL